MATAIRSNRWQGHTVRQRFDQKVDRSDPEGCWIWLAATDGNGYGQINVGGRPVKAHRLAWQFDHGRPIPDGLSIDHLCRTRLCVNPAHLEAVSLIENTRRQLAAIGHHNARKTHCPSGHPYDEENTRYSSRGYGRVCRICRAESNRRYRASRRAA